MTVIQRFGSALNPNLHFHVLLLDGLFVAGPSGTPPRFQPTRRWTQDDVDRLVVDIATQCEALLARRGHGPEARADDAGSDGDDALPLIQSASVAGRSAVRDRPAARRLQLRGGRPYRLPPLCATPAGYSMHAGVVIRARDRAGLQRLAGYIARPTLAKSRLTVLPDGRVRLGLKGAWSDGTTAHVLTAEELVVPPGYPARRWAHATRQGGAARRLVALAPRGQSRHVPWSTLLWRTFDVVGAACPVCGQVMALRAVVRGPETGRILAGLERAARGPPVRALEAVGA